MGSPLPWSTEGRMARAECPPSDGHDSLIYFSDQPRRWLLVSRDGVWMPKATASGQAPQLGSTWTCGLQVRSTLRTTRHCLGPCWSQ